MRVLIVHAHVEPKSFTAALCNRAVERLTAEGHEVRVSDLYAMGFNPVDGPHDFTAGPANPDFLKLQPEQQRAWEAGTLSPDIRAEQDKLVWCDTLVFTFPLYWFGLPAILKGWVDRVMSYGFAYARGRRYDAGTFRGKRAMLAMATGGPAGNYASGGLHGELGVVLWPIHNGIFRYLGFDVLEPFVAWSADRVDPAVRDGYLADWAARLPGLAGETPMDFHRADEFEDGVRLKPGLYGRTAGQRGRRLAPDQRGLPTRITEVGVAVQDLEQASALFRDLFDAEISDVIDVERYGMKFRMARAGEVDFELMEPTVEGGAVAPFLRRRGEGVHHVAFAVDDIRACMARLAAKGVRFVDDEPVEVDFPARDFVGVVRDGRIRVAFSHPKSHLGILFEFIEYPAGYRTGADG